MSKKPPKNEELEIIFTPEEPAPEAEAAPSPPIKNNVISFKTRQLIEIKIDETGAPIVEEKPKIDADLMNMAEYIRINTETGRFTGGIVIVFDKEEGCFDIQFSMPSDVPFADDVAASAFIGAMELMKKCLVDVMEETTQAFE